MKKRLIALLLVVTSLNSQAQVYELTLKPGAADGKDAYVHDRNVNENLGVTNDYAGVAWTCQGSPCVARSLIDFDWTLIPQGATIVNAVLKLYINPSSSNGTSTGDNICWVERITSPWDEMTVTWNTQPGVTPLNRISTGPASGTTGNTELNVTQLVMDMLSNPSSGYGFRISLNTEQYYRMLLYASSDHINCALHPELRVQYTMENSSALPVTHLSLQPDGVAGKDAYVHDLDINQNLGNSNEIASVAWTCSGTPCIARSFIDFDLSSIPSNTEILEATLYLAQNANSSNGPHSGINTSTLKMITESWNEQTVTWANAPATTSFNQVTLDASTSGTQHYAVNVKELIQDYVNNPSGSFGMMLSLASETTLKRMTFASSDHSNCTLRPKLEVSYRPSTLSITEKEKLVEYINIYPNPTSGVFNLETREASQYILTDLNGSIIMSGATSKGIETILDISRLTNGIYFIQVRLNGNNITKKIIKN